jgi:hypothetical protein
MIVTELMENFRAALLALLPMAERVGITWRRGEAYDEWDGLANCLFEQLVESPIRWSLSGDSYDPPTLAAYDMMLLSYRDVATIEVDHVGLGSGRWIFHAFGTEHTPFDIIEVRKVSVDGLPCGDTLAVCAFTGARFVVRLRSGSLVESLEASAPAPGT